MQVEVEFEFYATLRDAVGERTLTRTVPEGATVTEALRTLTGEYPSLGPLLFDGEGRLRPHVSVLVDGERTEGGRSLAGGETVGAAPAVAGGRDGASSTEGAR
ncbi:ubiquitin-like small modifier protein 1 [Halomarina oriensis]|uniref:Molybdopterin synthase sulfur carrier subunit n=1 Tax=Halomarina oriensis TaxID=671145 RepID=A0A6B0GRA8_9EURY|nr:ubiquitin-like small modifier protein 1 [Halomarina oriensis]MWG36139.1 molybdopterin synthase sulfur carrier subunit [Halomarina oriensis]